MEPISPSVHSFPHTQKDRQKLAQHVEVGDIVYTKFTRRFTTKQLVSSLIYLIQAVSRKNLNLPNNERMIHPGIVVKVDREKGEVVVAEAMNTGKNNELREIGLFTDKGSGLWSKESPYEFHIMRSRDKDRDVLGEAAKIANLVSTKVGYLEGESISYPGKGHKFSVYNSIGSMFRKYPKRTNRTAKRLFMQVADEHLRRRQEMLEFTGKRGPKRFFCSHFVAHAIDQAEIGHKMEEIKQWEGVKEGLARIEAEQDPTKKRKLINRFGKKMCKQHAEKINNLVTITGKNIDAKHTSPQQLYQSLLDQKFETKIIIVPQ